ncbi:MAG: hypothetical protein ACJ76F_13550 [Bacteroidia bacterium]
MRKPVCIYVDNSNIFIGGRKLAKFRDEDPTRFRIDFANFLFLVTRGTMVFDELVWAGSGDENMEEVFNGLPEEGVDLQLIPQTRYGEAGTVDQAIQLAMYRRCRKYRSKPGLIVLCTGDGKGYEKEKGFLYDVRGFIEDGWSLALYSWDYICHRRLKQFALKHGHYFPLEKYYQFITFIKGRRKAKSLLPLLRHDKKQHSSAPAYRHAHRRFEKRPRRHPAPGHYSVQQRKTKAVRHQSLGQALWNRQRSFSIN